MIHLSVENDSFICGKWFIYLWKMVHLSVGKWFICRWKMVHLPLGNGLGEPEKMLFLLQTGGRPPEKCFSCSKPGVGLRGNDFPAANRGRRQQTMGWPSGKMLFLQQTMVCENQGESSRADPTFPEN